MVVSPGVAMFFSAAVSFGAGLAGLTTVQGVSTAVLTVFWMLTFASLAGGVVSLNGQRSRRQQVDREVDEVLDFVKRVVERNDHNVEIQGSARNRRKRPRDHEGS